MVIANTFALESQRVGSVGACKYLFMEMTGNGLLMVIATLLHWNNWK